MLVRTLGLDGPLRVCALPVLVVPCVACVIVFTGLGGRERRRRGPRAACGRTRPL
ncbi:hypothetical protein [Kocuria varians]|uniref:hypothetical protein n=1 Tax=Kocuria varians TaxID=1272 RepID=UPI0012E70F93|nr:hypothetical protein [Kocuria varians]